jgi:hypothetical protein
LGAPAETALHADPGGKKEKRPLIFSALSIWRDLSWKLKRIVNSGAKWLHLPVYRAKMSLMSEAHESFMTEA